MGTASAATGAAVASAAATVTAAVTTGANAVASLAPWAPGQLHRTKPCLKRGFMEPYHCCQYRVYQPQMSFGLLFSCKKFVLCSELLRQLAWPRLLLR